ncbi:hypothetical protein EDC01DRAFT_497293 [Geopyxis carbonaria]|nr:hypothetical protein EDC01DRAFT_497293 [Geopyxis carbonaria]
MSHGAQEDEVMYDDHDDQEIQENTPRQTSVESISNRENTRSNVSRPPPLRKEPDSFQINPDEQQFYSGFKDAIAHAYESLPKRLEQSDPDYFRLIDGLRCDSGGILSITAILESLQRVVELDKMRILKSTAILCSFIFGETQLKTIKVLYPVEPREYARYRKLVGLVAKAPKVVKKSPGDLLSSELKDCYFDGILRAVKFLMLNNDNYAVVLEDLTDKDGITAGGFEWLRKTHQDLNKALEENGHAPFSVDNFLKDEFISLAKMLKFSIAELETCTRSLASTHDKIRHSLPMAATYIESNIASLEGMMEEARGRLPSLESGNINDGCLDAAYVSRVLERRAGGFIEPILPKQLGQAKSPDSRYQRAFSAPPTPTIVSHPTLEAPSTELKRSHPSHPDGEPYTQGEPKRPQHERPNVVEAYDENAWDDPRDQDRSLGGRGRYKGRHYDPNYRTRYRGHRGRAPSHRGGGSYSGRARGGYPGHSSGEYSDGYGYALH